MKVKCAVIEDLLPLYIDEVCSQESKRIVEEHLSECHHCKAKYNAQKSALEIDNNVIMENLKSKDPFKKIKRYEMLKLIMILTLIPILYLSFMEIRGDGVGFSALLGKYKTEQFFSSIEKGQFADATNYSGFSGGVYQSLNEKAAKEKWIAGMEKLWAEGVEFTGHRDISIITDDRFTSGYVTLSIKYEKEDYSFRVFVSTNSGKVELGGLSNDVKFQYREPSDKEKMLIKKISEVMTTYNPG